MPVDSKIKLQYISFLQGIRLQFRRALTICCVCSSKKAFLALKFWRSSWISSKEQPACKEEILSKVFETKDLTSARYVETFPVTNSIKLPWSSLVRNCWWVESFGKGFFKRISSMRSFGLLKEFCLMWRICFNRLLSPKEPERSWLLPRVKVLLLISLSENLQEEFTFCQAPYVLANWLFFCQTVQKCDSESSFLFCMWNSD